MSLEFRDLIGKEIAPYVDRLAELRMTVFREFPYLYDGTSDYEAHYLERLLKSPHGYVVLACADDQIVGASTAMPLTDADPEFQEPVAAAGMNPEDFFYFSESVLLPAYRGHHAGQHFFREREDQAAFLAYPQACFYSVRRPQGHPAKPEGYHSLNTYWKRLDYHRRPEVEAKFSWRDLGEALETAKPMDFWTKKMKKSAWRDL